MGARVWLLIVVAALASHGAVLLNAFVWDDVSLVEEHPRLGDIGLLGELLQRDYGLEFGDRRPAGYFRPLFMALLVLERQVFGLHPAPYHAVNLATLALAACLVAGLVWRLTRRRSTAVLAACIYACHPMKAETATFVMAWPDLFVGLATGGALWLGLAATTARRWRRTVVLAAASGLAVLASTLSKEAGFFAAAGLVVGLAAVSPRKRARGAVVAGTWMVALGVSFWLRSRADLSHNPVGEILAGPFTHDGAAAALWSIGLATRLFLVPSEHHYLYYCGLTRHEGAVPAWASVAQIAMFALAVVVVLALGWLVVRRRPLLAALVGWVVAGSYPLVVSCAYGRPFAARYVAIVPLCVLAGLGLARWVRGLRGFPSLRRGSVVVAAWAVLGLCLALSLASSIRALTPRSFWSAAVADSPRASHAHASLARAAMADGDVDVAERHARIAIRLQPHHPLTRRIGPLLGMKAFIDGRPADALTWYDWTLEARPFDVEALKGRAVVLFQMGRSAEAREAVGEAVDQYTDDRGVAQVQARIAVLSSDVAEDAAAALARRARDLGAEIPIAWTTPGGVADARRSQGP